MTLLAEIQEKCPASILANHDAQSIADAVNVGRVKVVETMGGIGLVLETLGPIDGAALLDSLESMVATESAVKWALVLINRGELNFGAPATRRMIDLLLPASAAAALKEAAEVPDPVSEFDVRCSLWDVFGNWIGG